MITSYDTNRVPADCPRCATHRRWLERKDKEIETHHLAMKNAFYECLALDLKADLRKQALKTLAIKYAKLKSKMHNMRTL